MSQPMTENALTEIALALAMAFFSILTLTLVSMGAGQEQRAMSDETVMAGARIASASSEKKEAGTITVGSESTLILFHSGVWRDRDLAPVDPAGISGQRPVFLAVDGTLPFDAIVAARRAVPAADVTVVPLDDRWKTAIERTQSDED